MERNLSTFNFKPPWALLMAMLIVVALELVVFNLPRTVWGDTRRYASLRAAQYMQLRARLETIAPDRPVVAVLGSSQVREGLDPNILESLTAGTSLDDAQFVILGAGGVGAAELYASLDLVLKFKPKLVILNVNPRKMYVSQAEFTSLSEHTYSVTTAANIAAEFSPYVSTAGLEQFATRAALFNMIPSTRLIRSYNGIDVVKSALAKNSQDTEYFTGTHAPDENFIVNAVTLYGLRNTEETPVHKKFAWKTAERLFNEKVPFLLLDFPVNPARLAHIPEGQAAREETRLLQLAIAHTYGAPYISYTRLPQFDLTDFDDTTHLNYAGRQKMSRYVAEQLSRTVQKTEAADGATTQYTFRENT